jgi:hypothetical protein
MSISTLRRSATVIFVLSLFTNPISLVAFGQSFSQFTRVNPVQPLELSGFGAQVAIGDGYAVTRSVQYAVEPNTQAVDVFRADDGIFLRTIPVQLGDVASSYSAIHSLAIDQGRLLVGSSGLNYGAAKEAQLFDLATGNLLQSFYVPSAGSGFGFSVDIHDNWAVIGDPVGDKAYVFDAASGDLVTTLVPSGTQGELFRFGTDISIDGNRAVIADHSRNSVYIYDTQTWILQRTITKTSDFINWFGASVDLQDDMLVVGAMSYTAYGPALGGAFVYDLNSGTEIELIPDEYAWHVYGMDVAIHGNIVAVGGTAAGWDILRWGSVGIFDASTGEDMTRILHPEPNWATSWGWGLDFDEKGRLAIGDYLQRYDNGVNYYDRVGSIYVYQIPEPDILALAACAFLSITAASLRQKACHPQVANRH